MKRTILFLSLALTTLFASAQTGSIPAWRFAYEYRCVDSERIDLQFLDIMQQGGAVHYYSFDEKSAEEKVAEAVAMDNLALGLSVVTSVKRGVPWEVYRNFPETGKLTFVSRVPTKFRFTEDYESPEWALQDETREILGYECKRAETDFRGRHWVVWFAEDLPLPFGPWELGALPGLILEANDSDSLVSFKLVGAETVKVEPFKIEKKFTKTTRKDYNCHLRIHDADPLEYERNYEGKHYRIYSIRDKNGKELKKYPPIWRIYLEKMEGDRDVVKKIAKMGCDSRKRAYLCNCFL